MIKSGVLKDASGVEQRKASVHLNPGFINVPSVTTVKHHVHYDVYIEIGEKYGSEHTALKSDLKLRHGYELTLCKPAYTNSTGNRTRNSVSEEKHEKLEFTQKNSTKEIAAKLRHYRCQDDEIKGISMRGLNLEDLFNEMKSELQEEWKPKSWPLPELQFKDCGITVSKLKKILILLQAKEVKSLDISWNESLRKDIKQLYGLLQEKKVDRLNVSKCELSPNHLKAFFDSIPEENTYELQELDISNLTLPTDTSLENLASVVHRLHVRKLILAESKIDFEKLLANPLMENITSLDLRSNINITQQTMESIAELKVLEKLVLRGCKLKSAYLQKIVDKKCQLTKFDISFNKFSSKEDGEMIGRAVVECGIHNLNISHTDLTSEMLEAFLKQIKKAKTLQLEVLNVNGNWGMGKSGLVCVGEIVYRCTLMTSFQFRNCNFSPEELNTIESNQTLFEKLERFKVWDDNMIDTKDMKRINEKFNTKSDPEKQKNKLQSTVYGLQSSKLNADGRNETEKTPTKPSSPKKLACKTENLEYSEKNTTEDVAAGLDVVVREAKRFRKLRIRSVKLNVTVMKKIASAIEKQSVMDELQMQECGFQSAEIKQLTDDLKDSTVEIKKIDIGTNKRIEEEAMESIVMFVAHHRVNYLILSNCQLKRTHIEQLGKAIEKHRIKLQTLDISNLTLPTADGITDLAKAIIDLEVEHLIMRECKLDFKALFQFSFMKLAKLDLSHSKLNVESIKCLSKVHASEVVLSNCNITFEHLVAMKEQMEKVQSLDIGYNEFTDEEDGKVIGEIVTQLELEKLDICGTDLTEDTLEGFASEVKKSNPEKLKLKRLKLSENCGMGTKGLAIVGDIVETCKLQSLGMKNCDLSSPEISSLDKRLCELKLRTLKFLDLRDENKYTLLESIHGLERHVIDKKRFQDLHKTPGDECEESRQSIKII